MIGEREVLVERRTAEIIAQLFCPQQWRRIVKVARIQAEEELDGKLRGDDGRYE